MFHQSFTKSEFSPLPVFHSMNSNDILKRQDVQSWWNGLSVNSFPFLTHTAASSSQMTWHGKSLSHVVWELGAWLHSQEARHKMFPLKALSQFYFFGCKKTHQVATRHQSSTLCDTIITVISAAMRCVRFRAVGGKYSHKKSTTLLQCSWNISHVRAIKDFFTRFFFF